MFFSQFVMGLIFTLSKNRNREPKSLKSKLYPTLGMCDAVKSYRSLTLAVTQKSWGKVKYVGEEEDSSGPNFCPFWTSEKCIRTSKLPNSLVHGQVLSKNFFSHWTYSELSPLFSETSDRSVKLDPLLSSLPLSLCCRVCILMFTKHTFAYSHKHYLSKIPWCLQ